MRILTINVIGIPSGSSSDLVGANVFQDYDALVVNPQTLRHLYGARYVDYRNQNRNELASESGRFISSLNYDRCEQANGLLQRGGVIVCFIQPVSKSSYSWTYGHVQRQGDITNYDWLFKEKEVNHKLGGINYGKGETIDYIDSGHPFAEYLNTKPSWLAYVDKEVCEDWKILADAYGTHAVSLAKRVGLGHIVLLPSYYHHDNGELLERCIIKLMDRSETRPQPSWAKAISVPGQGELISRITQVNEQIGALEKERESLAETNNNLEHWKYLLYEKGKHQLEPAVCEALALLGCHIELQPDKGSDGLVSCDYGVALLEVVGSERTIRVQKVGQLIKNIGNYISEKGGQVKGILVGNPFCSKSLDNRPPRDKQEQLFAKELLESAEKQDIAVLLTTDLYKIVCCILEGRLSDTEKEALQERIFNGKGLVKLA